jgi:hypothetical protein
MRWYETILALEGYMAERMKPRTEKCQLRTPAKSPNRPFELQTGFCPRAKGILAPLNLPEASSRPECCSVSQTKKLDKCDP